jgi:rhodanese-related sulfurtransferase
MMLGVALSGAGAAAQEAGPARPQTPPDRVTVEELKTLLAAGKVFVLDVRYQIDRKVKGSTHVPLGEVEARLAELPRDREIVTYCS